MKISDISIQRRFLAWVTILLADMFYCYNFVVIDYIRPYILEEYPTLTLSHTAQFYTWQSAGAVVGALAIAKIVGLFGKKKTLLAITFAMGGIAFLNVTASTYWSWAFLRFTCGIMLGGYFVASLANQLALFKPNVHGKVAGVANSMFSFALIVIGAYAAYLASKDADWRNILYFAAVAPMVLTVALYFILPDVDKHEGYEEQVEENETVEIDKGNGLDILKGPFLKITLLCTLLAGLNFYGYQFFSGFVTTYLKEVREFDGEMIGIIFSITGAGSLIGCWVWGEIADRFGHKANALGFVAAGFLVVLFFYAPSDLTILGLNSLALIGFLYNFCLSSSSNWGAYFASLYPAHLKSYGISLFHVGRIIGMWAPMVLVFVKERTDLETAMWMTPVVWIIGGVIWMMLPETNKRQPVLSEA